MVPHDQLTDLETAMLDDAEIGGHGDMKTREGMSSRM